MRRATHLLLTVMVGGVLAGGQPAAATAAQRNTPAADRQSLAHNGAARSYIVRVPDAVVQRRERVPLVLVLHGGGGNALNAETMTGFTEKARKEGFIVAYPEGTSRGVLGLLTWNAGHCCGFAMQSHVDDVGFIGALIDQLVRDRGRRPRRPVHRGLGRGRRPSRPLSRRRSGRAPTAVRPAPRRPRRPRP